MIYNNESHKKRVPHTLGSNENKISTILPNKNVPREQTMLIRQALRQ